MFSVGLLNILLPRIIYDTTRFDTKLVAQLAVLLKTNTF